MTIRIYLTKQTNNHPAQLNMGKNNHFKRQLRAEITTMLENYLTIQTNFDLEHQPLIEDHPENFYSEMQHK